MHFYQAHLLVTTQRERGGKVEDFSRRRRSVESLFRRGDGTESLSHVSHPAPGSSETECLIEDLGQNVDTTWMESRHRRDMIKESSSPMTILSTPSH